MEMKRVIIRPFSAVDRDWLVDTHSRLYVRDEGFDDSFGAVVGEAVDAFLAHHDPDRERGWIAESEGRRLGSIFCVRHGEMTAKLRLFLLVPEARGQGVGYRMLKTCTDFARLAGYGEIRLWTHESHRAACALYASTGWELLDSRPVHSFGCDLVEQSWKFAL